MQKREQIKEGIVVSIPIIIGYIPIAIAFGILSKNTGITLIECVLFSALVFAGASQFMAINLIGLGTGGLEIVMTTFLVNFRHFLMSASLIPRLDQPKKKWFPLMAFGITDETFSVASFHNGKLSTELVLTIEISAYLSWVLGSGLGYMLEGLLPVMLRESMGIALYAMFAAFLIPEVKKSKKVFLLAVGSGSVNAFMGWLNVLSSGWNIVVSIVVVSLLGVFLTQPEAYQEEQEVTTCEQ
ncbi:AzlC family ABC transporter permease [Vallitalea okinawensis]|uniref:AzlC family ABC transporter permease n=1 Tax=Vallitalea okinawensis TaxID=2078660 RepID=UPI000CFC8366|nr:AzlC family ABC transporter permease [Vallitalea okinawensis]